MFTRCLGMTRPVVLYPSPISIISNLTTRVGVSLTNYYGFGDVTS